MTSDYKMFVEWIAKHWGEILSILSSERQSKSLLDVYFMIVEPAHHSEEDIKQILRQNNWDLKTDASDTEDIDQHYYFWSLSLYKCSTL